MPVPHLSPTNNRHFGTGLLDGLQQWRDTAWSPTTERHVPERRGIDPTRHDHARLRSARRGPGSARGGRPRERVLTASVPYTQMLEIDAANAGFTSCDVALVVGANDVTNPLARQSGNAVSGMEVLDVDHAKVRAQPTGRSSR